MQNCKKNSKTFKIIVLVSLIVIVSIIVIACIINRKDNNKNEKETDTTIKGTFYYNESVKYEFDGKGRGSMYSEDTKYDYTYTIDEQKIMIDFTNEAVHDATYLYKLEQDTLTLIGREGTTGGQYTLKKENK